ncbi:MAG: efflux RND transporter periplasmic adaptor subunit [Acidobacteria bacterium]|nr:MAG: efflux RND transporter periplasmic adaptor subunit [Acidobacteriota bacterium]
MMNYKKLFLIAFSFTTLAGVYLTLGSRSASPQVRNASVVTEAKPKILYYVDPMHPSYKSDKPGTAPDCGMELTPIYSDEEPSTVTPGTVNVPAQKQQLINLQVVEVKEQPILQTIHTVGVLQYDETKVAKIHTKIEGWIDKVFADYTGRLVRKGQPLFSIYSPDLVAAQQEYLLAVKGEKALAQSSFVDVSSGSKALKASAYQRLRLWDVSDQQIRKLEETGAPTTSMPFYSPVSGFVITKNVFDKQRITYDTEAYTIADLSTIWLMADIYEYEAGKVHEGQDARMTLSYRTSQQFHGKVSYLYPELNNATRTIKARIDFPNPNLELRPGMYANVDINNGSGSALVIPAEAIVDSGTRKIVFVQKTKTEFEPREISVAQSVGDDVVVTAGLNAGEKIVGSGNFLIDSESQLRSALQSMSH